jgi:hypothetical protein
VKEEEMQDREPVEIKAFGRTMFMALCRLKWEDMTPTKEPLVRHCDQCKTEVRRVVGKGEFKPSGQCINLYVHGLEFSGGPLYGWHQAAAPRLNRPGF